MDSFAAVPTEDNSPGKAFITQGTCENERIFSWNTTLHQQCWDGELEIPDVLENTMARFPHVSFLAINSKSDAIQRGFHGLFGTIMGPRAFYNALISLYRRYSTYPNFVSYIVDGSMHCFTQWKHLYEVYPNGVAELERHSHSGLALIDALQRLPLESGASLPAQCNGKYSVSNPVSLYECDLEVSNGRIIGSGGRGIASPFMSVWDGIQRWWKGVIYWINNMTSH